MKNCTKVLTEKEFKEVYGVSFASYCDIFPLSFSLFKTQNPLGDDYLIRNGVYACVDFLSNSKESQLLDKFKNNDKVIELIKREDIESVFVSVDTTSDEEEFIVEVVYIPGIREEVQSKIAKNIFNIVDSTIVLDSENKLNITVYEKDFDKIIQFL